VKLGRSDTQFCELPQQHIISINKPQIKFYYQQLNKSNWWPIRRWIR